MVNMILCTLIFAISVANVRMYPAPCNEDSQCSVGFFCQATTHSCHECLRCHQIGRLPGLDEYDCIKSDLQCGPCLEGLINNEKMPICWHPVKHSIVKSAHLYILALCFAASILLCLISIHNIRNWNTYIIKANIAWKEISPPNNPMAFTA